MKRLALAAAAALLAAAPASATPSRVIALGEMSRYIMDDSSVLLYPSLMPTYSHMVYVDLGGAADAVAPGFNDMQASGLNGGTFLRLRDGLFLGVVASDFQPGEHAGFLDAAKANANGANGGGFAPVDLNKALRRYDVLGAFEFSSRLALGVRLSYGSQTSTYLPDENAKDSEGKVRNMDTGGISQFGALVGLTGQVSDGVTFDVALGYTRHGVTYLKSEQPTFDGGGGNVIGVSGRARLMLSKHWDIVPQVSYKLSMFSLGEGWTVPALTEADNNPSKELPNREYREHSRLAHALDAGAALVLRASSVTDFWLAVGTQYGNTRDSVDVAGDKEAPDFYKTTTTSMLALPYVKFGVEAKPLEWLQLRAGAEKYDISGTESSLEEQRKDRRTVSTEKSGTVVAAVPDFAAFLGASVLFHGFTVDLLVDKEFLKRGPYFLTGAAGNIAARASVSYQF